MKIAITGHTSGIGKSIHDLLQKEGHDVTGYSRSNGWDLSNIDRRKKLCLDIDDAEVFINNALPLSNEGHPDYWAQVDLLYRFYYAWKDTNKIIICIGSNAAKSYRSRTYPSEYAISKVALHEAVYQLQSSQPTCKIVVIAPGYVDTPMVADRDQEKLDPLVVANVVRTIINQPANVHIGEISLKPYGTY